MSRKPHPICPTCGERAQRSETTFGPRHECCGLWSWGYKPLADRATHRARLAAHIAFDPIWESGALARGEAYLALQWATGLSQADCHMSQMTREQAEAVPAAASRIWSILNSEPARAAA